jgi:hypothetical protein
MRFQRKGGRDGTAQSPGHVGPAVLGVADRNPAKLRGTPCAFAENKASGDTDLRVPLNITVLNSKEINALALPGPYVFLEGGILEAVDDESQLAGVIAHEMSHVVARHGRKLMTKATVAAIYRPRKLRRLCSPEAPQA